MFKKGQKWYREEDVADSYDEQRFTGGGKILDAKEKNMLMSLVNPTGKKILDIATGTGRFAELLSSEGGDVVGLDASKEMLTHNKVECLQGDALNLPFKDKCFDVSTSMRFLHLLDPEDVAKFVKEVERVTRDKFVFESLHPMSLRLFYQWALPQDSRLYSNSCLIDIFENLEVVKDFRYHESFLIPYGLYQILPENVAEGFTKIDEMMMNKQSSLASTVYWELYF